VVVLGGTKEAKRLGIAEKEAVASGIEKVLEVGVEVV